MKRIFLATALVLLVADFSYGQSCQAYINGARVRMQSSKWEEAAQVLKDNMAQCDDKAEFHYLYGISAAQADRDSTDVALQHIARADELNGDPPEDEELQANIDEALEAMWGPMVNEGVRLLTAGDLDAAEEKLRKAVEIKDDGKEGHLALGAVAHARGNLDEAVAHYQRAIEIDPKYELAVMRLGQVYQAKADQLAAEDPEEARELAGQAAELYETYLEENPVAVNIKVQLAGIYAGLEQMEKAEPVIREIMDSDSITTQTFTDFGFRLANAQQFELAEEVLDRAITLSDSLASEPLSYQAFVNIQTGDLEEAKLVLAKQTELEPANAEAWENLGFVLRDLGDQSGAMEAFQTAEDIPIALEQLAIGQNQDRTWSVEATFSNRTEEPIQNVQLKFSLMSGETGEIVETRQVAIAGEPLQAGQAERVAVDFTEPVDDAYVKYELADGEA